VDPFVKTVKETFLCIERQMQESVKAALLAGSETPPAGC